LKYIEPVQIETLSVEKNTVNLNPESGIYIHLIQILKQEEWAVPCAGGLYKPMEEGSFVSLPACFHLTSKPNFFTGIRAYFFRILSYTEKQEHPRLQTVWT